MPPIHLAAATAQRLRTIFDDEPFTSADAYAAGITERQLRTAVQRLTVVRLVRGVFAVASITPDAPPDFDHAVRSLQAAISDSVASHEAAAELHGLFYLRRRSMRDDQHAIALTVDGASHVGRDGYRTVKASLPASHRTLINDVHLTTVARTTVDLARGSQFREGLVVADSAMRLLVAEMATARNGGIRAAVHDMALVEQARQQLLQPLKIMRGWPGTRIAREVILSASPAAESPLESLSRGSMILRGIPAPLVNWPIHTHEKTYWADFYWEDFRLIGEADGESKYKTISDHNHEKWRELDLMDQGLTIERWGWHHVYPRDAVMLARLHPHFR